MQFNYEIGVRGSGKALKLKARQEEAKKILLLLNSTIVAARQHREGSLVMTTLVIAGDIFCDIMVVGVHELPKWGEDSLAEKIELLAGGSALNITVHSAAYLQYKSSSMATDPLKIKLYSSVGGDMQGNICLARLSEFPSIDTKCILSKDEWRTGSCVVLSGNADRSFVTDRGCVDQFSLDLFHDSMFQYEQNCHYHIGGFYNCTKLSHEVMSFFRKVCTNEVTTSLNPQCDASGKYELIDAICPHLTFFIANEAELQLVSKLGDRSTLEEQAQVLLNWGCKAVVVTLGKRGAAAYFGDRSEFSDSATESTEMRADSSSRCGVKGTPPATPPTSGVCRSISQSAPVVQRVVDTTGAGDAFAGAFLVEWCLTRNLRAGLRAGCTAGSAAVTLVGGSSTCRTSLEIAHRKMASPESS